jgi:hypothetical protein
LDLDGLSAFNGVEEFLKELPSQFNDVSYIVQESPSSGIKPGLRAHVFFMLDQPVNMADVKTWVMEANLVTEKLRDEITLTAKDFALSYPLDRIANDNGRVVYITPPECVGFEDPVKDRIRIVSKARERLFFNFRGNIADVKAAERKHIDALRDAKGLKKSRVKDYYETTRSGLEVLKKNLTEPGRIHPVRKDSDTIIRCNLDDGDSEAYFYYVSHPKFLRNHKGEPNLYMEAVDPVFYAKAVEDAKKEWEKSNQPFVFRNRMDDKYYVGVRRGNEIVEQPNVIGSEQKIEDYFLQHGGFSVPDPIETWEMKFDPTYDNQWNPDDRVFNTWRKTEIMLNATYRSLPPTVITKVITHALGGGAEEYERFINWLAYIYQFRRKTGTAWILHGTQGTGKGLLVDHILTPIFGAEYVGKSQPRNLREQYNDFVEKSIIVNLDEFDLFDAGNEQSAVMQALKLWITDHYVVLRKMYAPQRKVDNYSNFIMTTNSQNAIPVVEGDRRLQFGVRQEEKLIITPDEVAEIPNELEQFAGYLSGYDVDKRLAHTALENGTKLAAMTLSKNSIEEFVDAVRHGDIPFFMGLTKEKTENFETMGSFKQTLNHWLTDAKAGKPSFIATEELLSAYLVATGERTKTITKFKKIMAHKGLPASRVRLPNGSRPWGWQVEWHLSDEDKVELKEHIKPVKSTAEPDKDTLQAPSGPPTMRT